MNQPAALSNTIWTSAELLNATAGKASAAWVATGVSIDSRSVKSGDLFVAIRGDNTDGHNFVASALENGAVAAVVDQPVDGVPQEKLVFVADTFKALQDMGVAARARCGGKIIGITGSVGKSGTKEMLGRAFSVLGQTYYSEKSYNNHWGVPLSLSRMHAGADFGIFEMGMNHAGEIGPLSQMVRPHVAIITTIAGVHAGNFEDGIDGIARAKAEIFDGMDENGIAILNADNAHFGMLKDLAAKAGIRHVLSFGKAEGADARLLSCVVASNGTQVNATVMGEKISFTLRDAGEHIACNALSVLLAVSILGGDIRQAARELGAMEILAGRGKREYINVGDPQNPVTLIDESYNASPVAMEAAFRVMALIDPGRGGRRIAILGDMYELGNNAAQIHRDLALPLQAAGVDLVYTCGPLMKNLYDAMPEKKRGAHRDESPELAQIVPDVLCPGDVVLVKGSRGGGKIPRMQTIVEALREIPNKTGAAANRMTGKEA